MIKYTNAKGSTIEIDTYGTWVVRYKPNGETNREFTFIFNHIPTKWKTKCEHVLRSLFDKNQVAIMHTTFSAAKLLFEWLESIGNPTLTSLDEIEDTHWGIFNQWMEVKKAYSFSTRHGHFYSIKRMIRESMLLELNMGTEVAIRNIEEMMPTHFKNVREQRMLALSEKVLTTEEMEKVLKVLVQQYHEAQEIIECHKQDLPPGIIRDVKSGQKAGKPPIKLLRHIDMLCVTAIWLGLIHGMRPEEFQSCTLEDIIEDPFGVNHKIFCHAPNKPERYIPISPLTLDIIKLFIKFTQCPREKLKTRLLCVDWKLVNNKDVSPYMQISLSSRLSNFAKKKSLKDSEGNLLPLDMENLRRTFGSQIASYTNNPELTRRIMGHEHISTTKRHYTLQRLSELSHNVSKALGVFALQLTMSYKSPVIDLEMERPELAEQLQKNPERDHDYGICTVPQTTKNLADSCVRAKHCFECEFLVVETRKRENFVQEENLYLQLANEETDERIKQQKLRRVQQARAWIILIDQKIEKHLSYKSQRKEIENTEEKSRRKRSYAKRN